MKTSAPSLSALGVDPAKAPVVTRDQLKYAKPDPDLFLAAAERLGARIETVVIGDAIWVDSLLEGGELELPLRSNSVPRRDDLGCGCVCCDLLLTAAGGPPFAIKATAL
jgi:hypothetical protein